MSNSSIQLPSLYAAIYLLCDLPQSPHHTTHSGKIVVVRVHTYLLHSLLAAILSVEHIFFYKTIVQPATLCHLRIWCRTVLNSLFKHSEWICEFCSTFSFYSCLCSQMQSVDNTSRLWFCLIFWKKIFFAVFFKFEVLSRLFHSSKCFVKELTWTKKIFKSKRKSREKKATNFICKSKAAIIMGINENEFEHFKHVPALQNWIKTQPHLPQNIGKHSPLSARNIWGFRFRICFRGNFNSLNLLPKISIETRFVEYFGSSIQIASFEDSKWRREKPNQFRSPSVYDLSRSQEGSSGNAKMCFHFAR